LNAESISLGSKLFCKASLTATYFSRNVGLTSALDMTLVGNCDQRDIIKYPIRGSVAFQVEI
jgi:hypothetical protein